MGWVGRIEHNFGTNMIPDPEILQLGLLASQLYSLQEAFLLTGVWVAHFDNPQILISVSR